LTYNSHPLGCATALATLKVYEEDRLIDAARHMGGIMRELLAALQAKHAIVGAVRSIGLFGIVELVKDRESMEPLAPFNGTSEPMNKLRKIFRDEGLYTFVRMNYFFANPPLTITEEELRHGFDIFDRALTQIA
ncbi:MAG: aminotransferase class III-fold pyridoxal phosphate-dependent enzyme, partial [Thermoanaerobaculia bacterium]